MKTLSRRSLLGASAAFTIVKPELVRGAGGNPDARAFIGMWKGGTPGENVGEEHDKYIYGRK